MAARKYEISIQVLKNIFQNDKRNFVSPSELSTSQSEIRLENAC